MSSPRRKEDWEVKVTEEVNRHFTNVLEACRVGSTKHLAGYHGKIYSNFLREDMRHGFDRLFEDVSKSELEKLHEGAGWKMVDMAVRLLPQGYDKLASFFVDV